MSKPFIPSIHPKAAATTETPAELLDRVATLLPDALALGDGSDKDRRAAAAVLGHVPEEAMRVALELGKGIPSPVWNAEAVERYLAERARLGPVDETLARLADVKGRLERHLAVAGEPAAKAVLDLYAHLKRRAERHPEFFVEKDAIRLAETLPHAVGPSIGKKRRKTAKGANEEEKTPPTK